MATKKKTEVTEEVVAVEATEAVEEAPKKTTKKSTSTKKKTTKTAEEVIEEFKEEPAAEVEVVGTKVAEVVAAPVEEVKEAPKAEPVKVEEPKAEEFSAYEVQVISPSGIFTFKNPGLDQPRGKVYARGSKLIVTEVKGNWAKVGEDKWIILSGAVVKI